MPWWIFVVIVVVAVVLVACFIYFLETKNEKTDNKIELSKKSLEDLVSAFDILIALAEDNLPLKEKLEEVQDKIRYSSPSTKKEVFEYERRIENRLGDLKLALARAKTRGSYHGAERVLGEIELLLIERNSIANKK